MPADWTDLPKGKYAGEPWKRQKPQFKGPPQLQVKYNQELGRHSSTAQSSGIGWSFGAKDPRVGEGSENV